MDKSAVRQAVEQHWREWLSTVWEWREGDFSVSASFPEHVVAVEDAEFLNRNRWSSMQPALWHGAWGIGRLTNMLLRADDNIEVRLNAQGGQVYSRLDLADRATLLPGDAYNAIPILALLDALKEQSVAKE